VSLDTVTFVVMFVVGLLVALGAAGLLWLNVIESGPAAAVGIVGIGLMASGAVAAARGRRARP
jgi:hypothetical protein